jgi:hypothetical protein
MRDLQEAIEASCRAIEQYMKDRGEQFSFHLRDLNMTRDAHHPITDFNGNKYPTAMGTTKISVTLDGVHLGTMDKAKQHERAALKARLKKPGDPKTPDVVADIPDAGYRAGVRALLEKFQKGIRNATELANSGKVPPHLKNLVVAAEKNHKGEDPVVHLLRAILDLQDDRRKAQEETVRVRKSMEDNPEMQLQQRLKLKMKANYTDQRDVLMEFVKFMVLRAWEFRNKAEYGKVADGDAWKMVDKFLEEVGEQ